MEHTVEKKIQRYSMKAARIIALSIFKREMVMKISLLYVFVLTRFWP